MTKNVEHKIKTLLAAGYPTGWCAEAVKVIQCIPRGKLATYEQISRKLEERTGHRISPRTIGWLRRSLYEVYRSAEVPLAHRSIPLYRIAVKGDISSAYDSDETRRENEAIRLAEGFSPSTPWVDEGEW